MVEASTEQNILRCRMPFDVSHPPLVPLKFHKPIREVDTESSIGYMPQLDLSNGKTHSWSSANINHVLSLTVQSSEQEAMILSLKGFHLMSKTGPLCPVTRHALKSNLPVCKEFVFC